MAAPIYVTNNAELNIDPDTEHAYRKFDTRFKLTSALLPPDHPTNLALKKSCDKIAKVFGVDSSKLSIEVYRAGVPNAHINPLTGKIAVTSTLLEVLDYRDDLVESVIAHEIGHFMSMHHSPEPVPFDDSPASYMGTRVLGYEEEYQVDRQASLAMSLMGKDPTLINQALSKMQDWVGEHIKKDGRNTEGNGSDVRCNETGWIMTTHPFSSRRSFNIEKTSRSLPSNTAYDRDLIPKPKSSEFTTKYDKRVSKKYVHDDLIVIQKSFTEETAEAWWFSAEAGLLDAKQRHKVIAAIENYDLELCRKLLMEGDPYRDTVNNPLHAESRLFGELVGRIFKLAGYRNREYVPSVSDLKKELLFLRSYASKFGVELVCGDPTLINMIATTFNSAKSDNERSEIVNLCNGFTREIFMSSSVKNPTELGNFFKGIQDWTRERNIAFKFRAVGLRRDNLSHESAKIVEKFIPSELVADIGGKALKIKVDLSGSILPRAQEKAIFAEEPLQLVISGTGVTAREIARALIEQYERLCPEGPPFQQEKLQRAVPLILDACQRLLQDREAYIFDDAAKAAVEHFLQVKLKDLLKDANALESHMNSLTTLTESEEDSLRESDYKIAYIVYSPEEFKSKFLYNRGNADDARYERIDTRSQLAQNTCLMWTKAYADDFSQQQLGLKRLTFLADTLPLASMRRDQLACNAVGYPDLKFNRNIKDIQETIEAETDMSVVAKLRDTFANPLLRMACARRLYEHYKGFRELPPALIATSQDLQGKDLPNDFKLEAVLACYNFKSYTRDELLKPLVDKALNQNDRNNIASLLLDSPVSHNKKRSRSHVVVMESLRDALNYCKNNDKRDALLYMLGHREFSTEALSFVELTEAEVASRRDTFAETRVDQYQPLVTEYGDDETRVDEGEVSRFKVRVPDIMMRLSQVSGTPLEILFEQGQTVSSEREQHEFIENLLFGHNGAMTGSGKDRDKFIKQVAALVVDNSAHPFVKEKRESVRSMLALIFETCPKDKMSKIFLDIWKLSREEGNNFPSLAAKLMQSYGPVMVKFGQFLSGMNIPQEWRDEFRQLCSKNTVADSTLVDTYLRYSFAGDHPFADIGGQINEGSMAACYQAIKEVNGVSLATRTDEVRAIKVFHPFVERELPEDINFVQELVDHINHRSAHYGGVVLPSNLPDAIEAKMREQINPKVEVANSKALEFALKSESPLKVKFQTPHVFDEESRGLVVSSKFQAGVELDDLQGLEAIGLVGQSARFRHAVGLEVLRQILEDGVFQADPNLGNFGVLAPAKHGGQPTVIWYDPGNIGRLDDGDRKLLRNVMVSLNSGSLDTGKLAQYLKSLIDTDLSTAKRLTTIDKDLKQWLDTHVVEWQRSGNLDPEKVLNQLQNFFAERNIYMKEQWVNLATTLGLLRPLVYDFTDLGSHLKPMIAKLMAKDFFSFGS